MGAGGIRSMPATQVRAMAEPFPREGLPLPEARGRVLEAIHPLPGHENLPLAACQGRVRAFRYAS
jgi:molybdopterin molybdotransferase